MIRVLHLVGSAESAFHVNLSRLYARDCLEAIVDLDRYESYIAYISPDGAWRFPKSLHDADIAAAQSLAIEQALPILASLNIDIALPQMFCLAGMTHYRALLDLLQIPYIGNPPDLMALTADKAKTKAIVAAAGVRVPQGEVLQPGAKPSIGVPAIVKPTHADNSLGITLVKDAQDYPVALDLAFTHSDTVIVEEFVPLGREVRCGIVVESDQLTCLPLEEYRMDMPIRTYASKLIETDQGKLGYAAKDPTKAWIVDANDPDMPAVWEAAHQCHLALGCRHYSLYDFRINPEGQPYFIEAGLYCSFASKSVLSTMIVATGIPVQQFFQQMVEQVLNVKPS